MVDFRFYAPTEVVFGKESEEHLVEMVRKYGGRKLLLHYGGHSAERSGLLGSVREKLNEAGLPFVELGGVKPNPRLPLLLSRWSHSSRFLLQVLSGCSLRVEFPSAHTFLHICPTRRRHTSCRMQ